MRGPSGDRVEAGICYFGKPSVEGVEVTESMSANGSLTPLFFIGVQSHLPINRT